MLRRARATAPAGSSLRAGGARRRRLVLRRRRRRGAAAPAARAPARVNRSPPTKPRCARRPAGRASKRRRQAAAATPRSSPRGPRLAGTHARARRAAQRRGVGRRLPARAVEQPPRRAARRVLQQQQVCGGRCADGVRHALPRSRRDPRRRSASRHRARPAAATSRAARCSLPASPRPPFVARPSSPPQLARAAARLSGRRASARGRRGNCVVRCGTASTTRATSPARSSACLSLVRRLMARRTTPSAELRRWQCEQPADP